LRQKNYPMNFLSIAQNRYTTKMYNGKRIPEDTLNQLKEILRLSPPLSTANLGSLFSWVMSVRMRFLRLFP